MNYLLGPYGVGEIRQIPDVAGVYGITDWQTVGHEGLPIYIGHGKWMQSRLKDEFKWIKSEIWHKCAPQGAVLAWEELIRRWSVGVLAFVEDKEERLKVELEFIDDYTPVMNEQRVKDLDLVAVLRNYRYRYLHDTGIARLYQEHLDRQREDYPGRFGP